MLEPSNTGPPTYRAKVGRSFALLCRSDLQPENGARHGLSQKCSLCTQMVFKGGAPLSKVFSLIDRFSEDIHLVLDWRLLGYDQEGAQVIDPRQERGIVHCERVFPQQHSR